MHLKPITYILLPVTDLMAHPFSQETIPNTLKMPSAIKMN
jgi:hypothetical protein